MLALLVYLLIPPLASQADEFVADVPRIIDDLEGLYGDVTGQEASDVGNRVQDFVDTWTDNPERFIGPITSIGLNVAGVLAALVLILITAYYMAVRPEPLVDGLISLFPPRRRDHARHVLGRLRTSWIGWMEGVGIDMLVTGVLLYIGLTVIGLDFAIFFAVLSAVLVVVPYFGAIAGAIPPVLFALTDSPGKALITLAVYTLVQQLESNVTIPDRHVAAHSAASGAHRDRRGGGGSALRVRRPVRGRADPLADGDRGRGVLGQAGRGVRCPAPTPGHRDLTRAW